MIFKTNKYRNHKTAIDGIIFDSKAEARRWAELNLLLRACDIVGLKRQAPFTFACGVKYIADFTYIDCDTNRLIAEDVKGYKTKDFAIKEKLFRHEFPWWELRIINAKTGVQEMPTTKKKKGKAKPKKPSKPCK